MHDEQLKAAVRDFLRNISHTAQREIEKALRQAIASGKVRPGDVAAAATLRSEQLDLDVTIHSRIEL